MLWQPSLPPKYTLMSDEDLAEAIRARRRELGSDLVILGHHYQQDDVIQHADYTGDSFKLAQLAARKVREAGAKYVVFCGVHFMAESADILTPDDVAVILPDLSAGCSMADMADYDQTVQAWEDIHEALDEAGVGAGTPTPLKGRVDPCQGSGVRATRIIPITYMNSSAAIKAFVGQHGGAVCTSSNAPRVIEWALEGGEEPLRPGEEVKILFIPDQHLGRNTAHALGFVTEVDAQGRNHGGTEARRGEVMRSKIRDQRSEISQRDSARLTSDLCLPAPYHPGGRTPPGSMIHSQSLKRNSSRIASSAMRPMTV
jgi:quinolinate synthase